MWGFINRKKGAEPERLADEYTKKTNWIFFAIGICLLLVFGAMIFSMMGRSKKATVEETSTVLYTNPDIGILTGAPPIVEKQDRGGAIVTALPADVVMEKVVLGSEASVPVTLSSTRSITLMGLTVAQEQKDSFTINNGTCTTGSLIPAGGSCTFEVLWSPTVLRHIQNTIVVEWKENNSSVFVSEKTLISVVAQSTDSNQCVVCEVQAATAATAATAAPKEKVFSPEGVLLGELDENGMITINGKKYKVSDDGLIYDEEQGIVAVLRPKHIALSLTNKLLGNINDNNEVISENGEFVGRILPDATIVDKELNILGAVIPMVSVIPEFMGDSVGTVQADGTIKNADGAVIGTVRVDGSAIDLNGGFLGYVRPWGLVMDLNGNPLGGVTSAGTVVNGAGQNIATVTPTGLAIDTNKDLIGGVVPRGVGVGYNCSFLGTVQMNGEIKDSFGQITGKVLLDGTIVNENYETVGAVVSEGMVISEKGQVLGFVNSLGKAVDKKGQVIGCVNPDKSVAAGKKTIGAVMPKGAVIGYGCKVLGSLYPNGKVLNTQMEVVGSVQADGYITDLKNTVIGFIVPEKTAIQDGCKILGLIYPNGKIIDFSGQSIGCVTPEKKIINSAGLEIGTVYTGGLLYDSVGKSLGRVRIDGKIIDSSGNVVGCITQDGTAIDLDGNQLGVFLSSTDKNNGVILDASGEVTNYRAVGRNVYSADGSVIGTLHENGMVADLEGFYIGFIPPKGTVFSPEGFILGRYSPKLGVVVDAAGERFGKVLPDGTVLSGDKKNIVGSLIADNTLFVDLNGTALGQLRIDGWLSDASLNVIGAVRADGTVIDKEGKIIGFKLPTGKVVSSLGEFVGTVTPEGAIITEKGIQLGTIQATGLGISPEGTVLGAVLPKSALVFKGERLVGGLSGQGKVLEGQFESTEKVTPFGFILSDTIVGQWQQIGPVVDTKGDFIGWINFKGKLISKEDGRDLGALVVGGMVLDKKGNYIGHLIPKDPVVDMQGQFLGFAYPTGSVYGGDNVVVTKYKGRDRFTSTTQQEQGYFIPAGVATDLQGRMLGWTNLLGQIVNGENTVIGTVSPTRQVLSADKKISGTFTPFSSLGINGISQAQGLIYSDASMVSASGSVMGKIMGNMVINKGLLAGVIRPVPQMVSGLVDGENIGKTDIFGQIIGTKENVPIGEILLNGIGLKAGTNKVQGRVVEQGYAVDLENKFLGPILPTGKVLNADKKVLSENGSGFFIEGKSTIAGTVAPEGTVLSVAGNYLGRFTDGVVRNNADEKIGTQIGTEAISADAEWLGGILPTGLVVNENGETVGIVSSSGDIIGINDNKIGIVLPNGLALKNDGEGKKTYLGAVANQGLAVSVSGGGIGVVDVNGMVLDTEKNVVGRVTDDGVIVSDIGVVLGKVLPFGYAVDAKGKNVGWLDSGGEIKEANSKYFGKIAINGAVKGEHYLDLKGAMVPFGVITNDCQPVGVAMKTGVVFNGRGERIGKMAMNRTALASSGGFLGRITRTGPVFSAEGLFLGQALPNASVINAGGESFACVRNDGSVVDSKKQVLGYVVERGPVICADGTVVRMMHSGKVVNQKGEIIGQVLGDEQKNVINSEGEKICRVITPEEEVIFNKNGNIIGTLDLDGVFKNILGEKLLQKKADGSVEDLKTKVQIARIEKDGSLVDIKGLKMDDVIFLENAKKERIGTVSGCSIINDKGEKIAEIKASGSILDLNGNLYGRLTAENKLIDASGKDKGYLTGTQVDLSKCGITKITLGAINFPQGYVPAGERTFLNAQEEIAFSPEGPYVFPEKKQVVKKKQRKKPVFPRVAPVDAEKLRSLQEQLLSKREIQKTANKVVKPPKSILAKAHTFKDKDWGSDKNISSWPVDMRSMILQDKAIPAVLVHSIDSRFAGAVPATAIVERHIYSEDGRNIIIPAGSRLIGEIASGAGKDHIAKLSINWKRLIRPDGGAFVFNNAQSGDAQGRGGVAAYLDDQLLLKYGKPFLVTILSSAIAYVASTEDTISSNSDGDSTSTDRAEAMSDARKNFLDAMDRVFEDLISEATNVQSVVYVPSGTRLTVFAQEDLWLRSAQDDEDKYNKENEEETGEDVQGAPVDIWENKRPVQEVLPTTDETAIYEQSDSYEEEPTAASAQPDTEKNTNNVADVERNNDDDKISQPVLPI